MKNLVLTLVAVAITTGALADSKPRAAQWNNRFGAELFKELKLHQQGKNSMISPISAYLALSMATNGAVRGTEIGMLDTLTRENIDRTILNTENKSLIAALFTPHEEWTLTMANSVWAAKNFPYVPEFSETAKSVYEAETGVIEGIQKGADDINAWVKAKTSGKIDKILTAADADLYLLNATYFKAQWKYSFPEKQTVNGPFHLTNGLTKQVPMMTHGRIGEKLRYVNEASYEAVALPYGIKEETSMVVVLPKQSISEFVEKSTPEELVAINAKVADAKTDAVQVTLPRFKYEVEENIKNALVSMGMARAFSPGAELFDLSRVSGLYFNEARQKTYIATDEKGTEAAAVTIIGGVTSVPGPAQIHVKFDRPFLYSIVEKSTGAVLFSGIVSDPSA